jgi:hypothetical protein
LGFIYFIYFNFIICYFLLVKGREGWGKWAYLFYFLILKVFSKIFHVGEKGWGKGRHFFPFFSFIIKFLFATFSISGKRDGGCGLYFFHFLIILFLNEGGKGAWVLLFHRVFFTLKRRKCEVGFS